MRNTIMTEKIARRGVRVPAEYAADFLEQLLVRDSASRPVVTMNAEESIETVRTWMASGADTAHHQGFPVVDGQDNLIGVVTRRDLLNRDTPGMRRVRDLIMHAPVVAFEENSLREAADLMVDAGIGRLPVVSRAAPHKVVAILTRGDLLSAHKHRLEDARRARRVLRLGAGLRPRGSDNDAAKIDEAVRTSA